MDNNFQEKLFDEDTDSGDDNAHGDVTGTVMRVLVPFPVAKAYDYAVPADMERVYDEREGRGVENGAQRTRRV